MGTPLQDVYDAFFAKIETDEWSVLSNEMYVSEESIKQDLYQIMESAITFIDFPRFDLNDHTTEEFADVLDKDTIQLLSFYMKQEFLDRTLSSWQNLTPLYDEHDFSPANLIAKLNAFQERTEKKIDKLQRRYNRKEFIDGKLKIFDYGSMAGDGNE